MNRKTDVRNVTPEMGSGKCADDSSQLKGEAKKSPTWNAKNKTTEYSTPGINAGKLGGQASH